MPGGGDYKERRAERVRAAEEARRARAASQPAASEQPTVAQPTGAFKLDTNISDGQAKSMAAQVTREQFERYMNEFAPVEKQTIASLGQGGALVAADNSTNNAKRSRAALERMRSRYGTSLTAGQRGAEDSQFQRATTLSHLGAKNTGRQMDEDRDFNLRGQMLNLGNNINSNAMSGLTDASINAQGRQNAHDQAKAQHSAQKSQQIASTVGTVATIGALVF